MLFDELWPEDIEASGGEAEVPAIELPASARDAALGPGEPQSTMVDLDMVLPTDCCCGLTLHTLPDRLTSDFASDAATAAAWAEV